MEHAMPCLSFVEGVTAANFFHNLANVDSLEDPVGREVNDAENRASAWWLDSQLTPLGEASSLPRFDAGQLSVIQSTVLTSCETAGGLVEFGAGPSISMTDFPALLWPVTMRRTGFAICSLSIRQDRDACPRHWEL
jgi:hypothetical protein